MSAYCIYVKKLAERMKIFILSASALFMQKMSRKTKTSAKFQKSLDIGVFDTYNVTVLLMIIQLDEKEIL